MDTLIEKIKVSMRIRHSELDTDIRNNIMAAASDLSRVGVMPYANVKKKALKEDPLIEKAVELYCKAQADFLGKGDQFEVSYEKLRDALSLCGDYNEQ